MADKNLIWTLWGSERSNAAWAATMWLPRCNIILSLMLCFIGNDIKDGPAVSMTTQGIIIIIRKEL